MSHLSIPTRRLGRAHPLALSLGLVVIFSLLRAGVGWAAAALFGGLPFNFSPGFILFSLAIFALLSVGFIGGGLYGLAGASRARLGWTWEGLPRTLGRSLLGFLLVYLLTFIGALLFVRLAAPALPAGAAAPIRLDPQALLMKALWGFLIAAWQEENLFRGYLQPELIDRLGRWPGIAAAAALFSLAHLGFHGLAWQFPLTFLTGLVLGWLRGRDRSLVPAFIVHGLSWPLIN